MSDMKPLIDALPFVKFTDRSIGNHFKTALERLDEDMNDEEYTPSDSAALAYTKLAEEIEDALAVEDEPPVNKEEVEQLDAKELEKEPTEEPLVTDKIDPKDLEEEDE